MARALIASDNFNRASLGSNWANLVSSAAGNITINASTTITGEFGAQPTNQIGAARWVGAGSITDDQYSSLVIVAVAAYSSSVRIGVIARASSGTEAARDYYQFSIRGDSATTPLTTLSKWVNGVETVLNEAALAWTAGDRIEIECEGTTIRACKNGTPLGGAWTVTDSSIATGLPGVAASTGGGNFRGDDWEGGNVTSAAGTLTFQGAGLEFGARSGIGIDTFSLENGESYKYQVYGDGLTLGTPVHTSAAITLDSAGKLPNFTDGLITPATLYWIVAINQTTGERCVFPLESEP